VGERDSGEEVEGRGGGMGGAKKEERRGSSTVDSGVRGSSISKKRGLAGELEKGFNGVVAPEDW
jgi:hypothetical protein